MILDYSRPRRGPTLGCCIRTLWSGSARVEFAQCASWAHAIVVLTSIATVAAILTASDSWLREAVVRGLAPKAIFTQWIFDEILNCSPHRPGTIDDIEALLNEQVLGRVADLNR